SVFKRFDLNGDGKISVIELGDCLKTLGYVTPEEVKRTMDEIDTEGDEFISYQEFSDSRQPRPHQRRRQDLLISFHFSFDYNVYS
ncbi:Polcalcin Bet v 4, partial [Linum grandiflorum]